MLQFFLIFLIKSDNKQFNKCQENGIFIIKNIDLLNETIQKGYFNQISFYGEINDKVENPILEIQIINDRLPEIRFRDKLCRKGVLICPASFSQIVYGTQFAINQNLET